jgi:hypothetical protein
MLLFQSKIKYQTSNEQGSPVTKTEHYLVNAVSYGDVEALMASHIANNVPEYQITISKKPLSEVFEHNDFELPFFQAKVVYISFDEKSQKEKKTPYMIMIQEADIENAVKHLKQHLGTLNDYEIVTMAKTEILEIVKPKEQ